MGSEMCIRDRGSTYDPGSGLRRSGEVTTSKDSGNPASNFFVRWYRVRPNLSASVSTYSNHSHIALRVKRMPTLAMVASSHSCTSPPWRCKLSVERWAVVHQGSSQARVGWGVARAPEGFGKPWRPLTAVSSLISVLLGSSVAEKTETKSLICLGAPEELVVASCASRREGTL